MAQTNDYGPVNQNISLFRELLTCNGETYHWVYLKDGSLLNTNSPHLVLNTIFEHSGSCEYMKHEFQRMQDAGEEPFPIILGGPVGLMWSASMEYGNGIVYYHVIGPVKRAEITKELIHKVAEDAHIENGWQPHFENLLGSIPSRSAPTFVQYALMLNFCVTGKKFSPSDIIYQPLDADAGHTAVYTELLRNRHTTYMIEQALLSCVRSGDLNYKPALLRAGQISNGIQISTKNPFTQAVFSTTSFATLCVRAAIEGGLSPDLAYTVGDQYIQSMVESKNISELTTINHTMLEDFIQRVHNAKKNPAYSRLIQSCCDYITLHVEDDELKLSDLSHMFGYSDYYFSRKFKKEVGVSLQEYIHAAKMKRAKVLLACSDLSISDIAERLHYCSSTHFSTAFRNMTGMLPSQYRDEEQKI